MKDETEVERKYKVTDGSHVLDELMDLIELGEFTLSEPKERDIIDKYFDTSDKRLLENNIAVRIRSYGKTGKFLQLKVRKSKKNCTLTRREIEGEKPGDFREILEFLKEGGYIDEVEVSEDMRRSLVNSGLEMILDLHNVRNSKKIMMNGKIIGKMELDRVEFEGGKFIEVELENNPNDSGGMKDFIKLFEKRYENRIEVCTDKKMVRAFEMME